LFINLLSQVGWVRRGFLRRNPTITLMDSWVTLR